MFVDYVSDLHLSHYVPFQPNQEKWAKQTKNWTLRLLKRRRGEVLIVAGDLSEWNQQNKWFLEEASLYYQQVYFVLGNHDYYLLSKNQKNKYGNSVQKAKELFSRLSHLQNVKHLHKDVIEYNGVTFAGHSMWYNLSTPDDVEWYKANSNDHQFIYGEQGQYEVYKELYQESINWYLTLENKKIDVFVSHFPPVNPPNSQREHVEAYVTDVPFLVGKHWVCGHQHTESSFHLFNTNFHMNPVGYPSEDLTVKLKTFKV